MPKKKCPQEGGEVEREGTEGTKAKSSFLFSSYTPSPPAYKFIQTKNAIDATGPNTVAGKCSLQ
jgi:hypothetical protein